MVPASSREPPASGPLPNAGLTRVGCCGFAGSQARYFGLFQLVEIQSTFYQLPRPQTAERWRAVAPPGFQFAMKAWQLITHEPSSPTYRRLSRKPEAGALARYGSFRPTAEVFEAWGRTAEFARTLGTMLVVFQCPASFLPTDEHIANMRAFFGRIERSGFHLLWEPRGDWPPDTVRGMCEELDLVHCVDPFKNSPVHGAFRYFRLHGVSGYSHRYTDAELLQLKEWAGHRPAYVLFNNSAMEEDALRFLELLGGQ